VAFETAPREEKKGRSLENVCEVELDSSSSSLRDALITPEVSK
jgi:hypothetical protein